MKQLIINLKFYFMGSTEKNPETVTKWLSRLIIIAYAIIEVIAKLFETNPNI